MRNPVNRVMLPMVGIQGWTDPPVHRAVPGAPFVKSTFSAPAEPNVRPWRTHIKFNKVGQLCFSLMGPLQCIFAR